jgi:voltage-gated potassium channel
MERLEERRSSTRWKTLHRLDDWLETPMLVLSVAWLGLLLYELGYGNSPLLETFGVAIWVIFAAEFALRLTLAPDKRAFLKGNWLTIAALLVPAVRIFRALRIVRAARALRGVRLVRIVGTANRSMGALRSALRRRRFNYVAAMTVIVMLLGAAGMLSFEPASEIEGGFTSYADALWWTAMLLTTIGSQYWPATIEGRILAFLISVYGLAVFGYITASFASFFVGRDSQMSKARPASARDMAALAQEVASLRRAIETARTDQRTL